MTNLFTTFDAKSLHYFQVQQLTPKNLVCEKFDDEWQSCMMDDVNRTVYRLF